MSDRERWIVYPLLIMALGLALQPKFKPLNVQFGEVKCAKLSCGEFIANDAKVARLLDAAQLKTNAASMGMLEVEAANIDIVNSKIQNSHHVRVTDAAGKLHAEVRSTTSGGQLDIVRYTLGGRARQTDEEVRMFATNIDRDLIPLGIAHLHWVRPARTEAKPIPADKPGPPPSATEPPESAKP
jgi:hypothetical protein